MAFADSLKDALAAIFRWSRDGVGRHRGDARPPPPGDLDRERRLPELPDNARLMITDARVPDEIAMTRRLGGRVIRIRRGPDPAWRPLAVPPMWATKPPVACSRGGALHVSE